MMFTVLPSSLVTRLNFGVDIFDGKLLVETINRTRLPAGEFGFLIGYELVSIDGQDAQKLLDGLLRYGVAANPRSTRRLAAQFLTTRPQNLMPHAGDVPEISTVVFRRPDDSLESHRIPWTRTGLPLLNVGRYITPRAAALPAGAGELDDVVAPEEPPEYVTLLNRLQNCRIPDNAVTGVGALAPVFSPSLLPGFVQRLGRVNTDPFYSGVFETGGLKIGFIRIPSYSPTNTAAALTAFAAEMAFFQANTDGLVVDLMRNPGGNAGYTNQILSLLIPFRWRSIPFEVRATSQWIASFSSAVEQLKALGAPSSLVDLYQSIKESLQTANRQMRGRTIPIALDGLAIDREPAGGCQRQPGCIHEAADCAGGRNERVGGGSLLRQPSRTTVAGRCSAGEPWGPAAVSQRWQAGTYSLGVREPDRIADDPEEYDLVGGVSVGAVCGEHRGPAGDPGGLHDPRQPAAEWQGLRRRLCRRHRGSHSEQQLGDRPMRKLILGVPLWAQA